MYVYIIHYTYTISTTFSFSAYDFGNVVFEGKIIYLFDLHSARLDVNTHLVPHSSFHTCLHREHFLITNFEMKETRTKNIGSAERDEGGAERAAVRASKRVQKSGTHFVYKKGIYTRAV